MAKKLTRREFFLRAARAAALWEVGGHLSGAAGAVAAAPLAAPTVPEVVVVQGTNNDTASGMLKDALGALGGLARFIKPGQSVCIKPNATWGYPPGTCSSTEPELLRTVIQIVRDAGASRISVVDHCTLDPGAAECLRITGIGKVLDEFKDVEKVFGDRFQSPNSLFTNIDFPKARTFRRLSVFKVAVEADVRINMCLAKSHWVTKFTLALKHLMGFFQWPTGIHADLEQGIADIATESKISCALHIMECIRVRTPVPDRQMAAGWGNEINDPLRVKRVNQMVVGTDPVLMDAYALSEYFGRQPRELLHVQIAHEMGLGEIDVKKAQASGRMLIMKAGQPIYTPTPSRTPTPSPTATLATQPTPTGPTPTDTPVPTDTPLPTGTPAPEQPTPQSGSLFSEQAPESTSGGVVNANAILNGALIPAAAIVAGLGIVLRRRNGSEGSADDGDR